MERGINYNKKLQNNLYLRLARQNKEEQKPQLPVLTLKNKGSFDAIGYALAALPHRSAISLRRPT